MKTVNGVLMQVDKLNVGKIVSRIRIPVITDVDDVDIKTTCRICLIKQAPENLFTLFSSSRMFQDVSVAAALADCFSIDLKQDEKLPNYVCVQCASSILQSYTFKKCIIKGQHSLEKFNVKQGRSKTNYQGAPAKDCPGILYKYLTEKKGTDSDLKVVGNGKNESVTKLITDVASAKENENHIIKHSDSHLEVTGNSNNRSELLVTDVDKENSSNSITDVNLTEEKETGFKFCSSLRVAFDHNYCKSIQCQDNNKTNDVENEICNDGFCDNDSELPLAEVESTNKIPEEDMLLDSQDNNDKSISEAEEHECEICSNKFDSNFKECYLHECNGDDLDKETSETDAINHMDGELFMCDVCGDSYECSASLKDHMQCHEGEEYYVCSSCAKICMSHDDYTSHTCVFYEPQKFEMHIEPKTENESEEPKKEEQEAKYQCDVCGRDFRKMGSLQVHYSRVHAPRKTTYYCALCSHNKRFTIHHNYKIHLYWHEVKTLDMDTPISCKFCEKVLDNKNALAFHLRTHMERPFACGVCNKTFFARIALQQHLRQHTDERPFNCKDCEKTFRSAATLRQHIKVHTGEKPYQCNVCSRDFAQQQQLISHTYTHTGEKKYKCPFCDKAFALNGNLTVHKRRHTGETPYVCDTCGKGFYDSSSMKKHKQSHRLAGRVLYMQNHL